MDDKLKQVPESQVATTPDSANNVDLTDSQPATPAVDDGVESQKDPNIYDPDGVPWRNRAREYERKYYSTLEKANTQPVQPPPPPVDENEEIQPTRANVKTIVSEYAQKEAQAELVFDDVIDSLAMKDSEIRNHVGEIKKRLKAAAVEYRANPEFVKAIATSTYGEVVLEKRAIPKPAVTKKLVTTKSSDVLPPSAQGGASVEINLTEAEQKYASIHRLDDRNISNEIIKRLYANSIKSGG